MSSDRELTHIVRSWLEEGVNVLPGRVLDDVLAELPVTPQRRPWWRAWRTHLMNSTMKFAAAGAVALVVAIVGLALYFSRPAIAPAASSTPLPPPTSVTPTQPAVVPATASPKTSPTVTTQPTQTGSQAPWVVFLRQDNLNFTGHDLWAMRVDGSDAHEILPGLESTSIAWSQDGRRLFVADGDATGMSHVYLADVSNLIGPFVDTGFGTGADTACLEKSREPFPCQDWGLSFAPDGERVVLLQKCTRNGMLVDRWADSSTSYIAGCEFLTILDLRTGELTELSETIQQRRDEGWPTSLPAWSVDGSMIAFARDSNLYIINADGTNLHMVDLSVSRVAAPRWSPDGTTLVFTSDIDYSMEFGELIHAEDIYTAHADGTDLRQLTTNGLSFGPEWTLSGQIRFRNSLQSMTYSLMDADGGNLRQYADLESLVRAIDPSGSSGEYAVPGYPSWQEVHWQPAESWQPSD